LIPAKCLGFNDFSAFFAIAGVNFTPPNLKFVLFFGHRVVKEVAKSSHASQGLNQFKMVVTKRCHLRIIIEKSTIMRYNINIFKSRS